MWNEEPPPNPAEADADARATLYYEERYSEAVDRFTSFSDKELETPAFPYDFARPALLIQEFILADEDCETVGGFLMILRNILNDPDISELQRDSRALLESIAHRYASYMTDYRNERWEFDKPGPEEFNEPEAAERMPDLWEPER